MRTLVKLMAAFAASLASSAALANDAAEDARSDIVTVRQGDAEMTAAMRRARLSLDDFLRLAASPPTGTSDFSLKVGLPLDDKDVEFVWVRPFRQEHGDFVGRLVNTPRSFPNLAYGQQIGFDRANVVDFAYRDGAQVKGHHTTCVLLKRMSEAQRADILATNPIVCEP